MKLLFIFLFLTLLSTSGSSQTGLFGRRNAVEFRYNAAPAIDRKGKLNTIDDDTIVIRQLRLLNSSYVIKYNRIIGNRFSIGIGFDVASMLSKTTSIELNTTSTNPINGGLITERNVSYILEPRINYRGLTVELNFFGSNGINPLGMRGGFAVDLGSLSSDYSNVAVFREERRKNGIDTMDDSFKYVNFETLVSEKRNIFNLRCNIGKSMIVTRRLLLNVDFNLSFFTVILNRNGSAINDGVSPISPGGSASFFGNEQGFVINDLDNFGRLERNSYRIAYAAYKKATLSFGLSYAF